MSHTNDLISFLRHYGPIPASDNMYDELIQDEIKRHNINPPIRIRPARCEEVRKNFESSNPRNTILTGTAGDGKTYHCRLIWNHFGGDQKKWQQGDKIVSIPLPASSKTLTIVKDLSELTQEEKNDLLPVLAQAVSDRSSQSVFLVAANDGQLLATWRDWADGSGDQAQGRIFRIIEEMLVKGRTRSKELNLYLYNLSQLDASKHFEELVEKILEHPQWVQCNGCELMNEDGTTTCPIRINRERLRGRSKNSAFRRRLGYLLRLARANRMHIPIRDLLLLGVNIVLGDRDPGEILLTCATAKNRAKKQEYLLTNPYANVFGLNLPERQRQQYQVFTTLEAFGIGRETDNKFDNLLIYELYGDSELYKNLVANDAQYGSSSYKRFLRDYLEGERENIDEFMRSLALQRQRLFFSIQEESGLDPWRLTVYQSSGMFLRFIDDLESDADISQTVEILVRGLNRTFCGMMIDDCSKLYLASSGGDGRGRIASLLDHELPTSKDNRQPYVCFKLVEDRSIPCLHIIDPVAGSDAADDPLDLQLTHFEYLVRVANGSLPASFSRQCHEDFLDFKLRVIKKLSSLAKESLSPGEVNLKAFKVDEQGRIQPDNIRIRTGG